ncbi:MAG: hypothetical protein FJZ58_07245, partial [Chlamydiae bacterium]|nr:hypothetical protein [Chlamydiota bacterium]
MTVSMNVRIARDAFIKEHGIPLSSTSALDKLGKGQIVMALDDSYSMNEEVCSSYPTGENNGNKRYRKEEAYLHTKIITKLAAIYDDSGVDAFCLNKGSPSQKPLCRIVSDGGALAAKGVHTDGVPYYPVSSSSLRDTVMQLSGDTPLVATLRKIVSIFNTYLQEGMLTIFCITDGEDSRGESLSAWVQDTFKDASIRRNLHITFVTVTDDVKILQYFRQAIDQAVIPGAEDKPHIDVVGSYQHEQNAFNQANPQHVGKFTKGMYLAKMIGGSHDQKLDDMDMVEVTFVKDGGIKTQTALDTDMQRRLEADQNRAAQA